MIILDPDRTEVRYNGEWLSKLSYAEVVRLARTITVARILERDDFAKRYAARRADLGLRAALPADAGVRLGRGRVRRRARRHRPALQPARRARRDGGLRPRAPGRADDAAAALVGRAEDELVRGQQHPADRRARGAVRPDDADSGLACSRSGTASSPNGPCRRATRWRRSSSSRGSSSRARTGRRPRGSAEEHFTRVVREGKAPEEIPEVALPDGDPVHLPGLLAGDFRHLDERSAAPDRPGRCLAWTARGTAAPEEMFGGRCGSPTRSSRSGGRSSPSSRLPTGDPLEAKLELARFIVGRSHGEEGARAAEEHFTRVIRDHEPPEDDARSTLCPPGDPVHLPALLADAFGHLDERGTPR